MTPLAPASTGLLSTANLAPGRLTPERRVAFRVAAARLQSQQLSLTEVQQLAAFSVRGRSMTGFWSKNPDGRSLKPQTTQGWTG